MSDDKKERIPEVDPFLEGLVRHTPDIDLNELATAEVDIPEIPVDLAELERLSGDVEVPNIDIDLEELERLASRSDSE